MNAMDWTGLFVLSYATVTCVWTLCEAHTRSQLRALAQERPSAIPKARR